MEELRADACKVFSFPIIGPVVYFAFLRRPIKKHMERLRHFIYAERTNAINSYSSYTDPARLIDEALPVIEKTYRMFDEVERNDEQFHCWLNALETSVLTLLSAKEAEHASTLPLSRHDNSKTIIDRVDKLKDLSWKLKRFSTRV